MAHPHDHTHKPTPAKPPVHPAIAALAKRAGVHAPIANGARCAQPRCATEIDLGPDETTDENGVVTVRDPSYRARSLAAHGFVEAAGKLYCSRRCCMIDQQSPLGLAGEWVNTSAPAKAPAAFDGARVRTSETTDANGVVLVRWAMCDHETCATKIEIPPGGDPAEVAGRTAQAHGFVQLASGTYCGAACARQHRADVVGGTKRESEPVAAAPTSPAALERYRKMVVSAAKNAGRTVDLIVNPATTTTVALIELQPNSLSRRMVAFDGNSLEDACAGAAAKLPAFLEGVIGSSVGPFDQVHTLRVGAISR